MSKQRVAGLGLHCDKYPPRSLLLADCLELLCFNGGTVTVSDGRARLAVLLRLAGGAASGAGGSCNAAASLDSQSKPPKVFITLRASICFLLLRKGRAQNAAVLRCLISCLESRDAYAK